MDLQNKTVAFLGDSITEGYGVRCSNRRYDNRLAKGLGLKSLNYGIGGTRIAHQHIASIKPRWDLYFCARAYNIDPKADLILVFGGTNDYGHGDAPFGTMEDTTPDTFCGAVDFLMRLLQEKYPKSRLAFVTPIRRQGDEFPSTHEYKQPDARALWDYARVILEKGTQYGIPVLDAYHELAINPNNEGDCAAYTVDGLHLNDAGHEKLAELIGCFLRELEA